MSSVDQESGNPRLGIFLAAAMFVFVIDTSFMNVSISAVVQRPGYDGERGPVGGGDRVAGVGRVHPDQQQARRPLRPQARLRRRPALLSARARSRWSSRRAWRAIIVFWAVIGGLGASLYLPAMQSLIHGNFEGKERAKVFALVGAAGRDRGRDRAADRRLRDDCLLVARGFPGGASDHRGRAGREQAYPGRAVYGGSIRRWCRRVPLGGRDGRA